MSDPVAGADVLQMDANSQLDWPVEELLANDSDPDGDALTIIGFTNLVNVTVTLVGDTVQIVPDPGFLGTASFDYVISDGNGGTATARVEVVVHEPPPNLPPEPADDTASTPAGTPLILTPDELLANDFDPDEDGLTIVDVSDAENGTVSIDEDGNIVFVPDAGYSGPASFVYTVDDGNGGSATATVEIDVVAGNTAPVAGADSATATEDTPLVMTAASLLSNDSDADGDSLTIIAVGNATNGTVNLSNGTITFTPVANHTGPASVTYTVSDGRGGTSTGTVNVNVVAVNDAPAAANDTVAATEDTALVLTSASLLANDSDVDGDTLTITAVGGATHGTVALNGGNVVFTPAANYNGPATFTYTVSDGHGGTSTATVTVDVAAVNDAPVAANNTVSATEDASLALSAASLLANDSDVDGDTLTITGVGNATNGTVALDGGNITFTPAANYNGPATFTYTVSDGQGGSSTATVTVNVAAVNDAPVAADNSVNATEDTPLVLSAASLLANDSDVDGNTLTISSVGNATNGTVALNGGNVVFTPAANYNGPASFTYTVSDGQGGSSTATVTVNVAAVNDAPVAADNSVNATEDTPLVLSAASLLANDSDVDGNTLTITSVGNATHGTVQLNGGNVVFTPAANYSGPASFTYTVADGQGGTATATVNVTVAAVNDAPVAANDSASATAGTALVLTPATLLANDSDVDGNNLTITSVGGATHGTVALNGGNVVFTPAANYSGPASFTYTVSDGHGGTSTATVSVDVAPQGGGVPGVDAAPAAGSEDTKIPLSITCDLPAGVSASTVSILISGLPAGASLSAGTNLGGGTWSLTAGQLNGLTLTPPSNSGADFSLTVTATGGGSATAVLPVTVAAVADAPKLSVVTPTVVSTKGVVLNGTNWGDWLAGGAGADTISGGKGDDVIIGDRRTRGGSASLNIKAALTDLDGSETLAVKITGLPPCASLSAGTRNADGSWTLTVNQLNGLEVLFPAGTPTFTLTVTAIATDIDPDSGAVDTESVTATIQVKTKPEGNDVLKGGDGNDEIWGTGGNDSMAGDNGNDYLSGGGGNDAMTGDAGNDLLQGREGNDTISGGSGNDGLTGDDGNDRLSGGDGNDWMSGGDGNDSLSGDAGNDDMNGGSGADTMSGGDGNDRMYGGSGNDKMSGCKGNDELIGGDGNDSVCGDAGNDELYGGSGNDSLSGGNDNDVLRGGSGNDLLSGGSGRDWIEGGSGADTLSGGSDRDYFVFNSVGEGVDVITDFGKGDVIVLEDVLSGCIRDGDEAVDDGFVRFVQSGRDTLVQVDRNGGGNGFQTLVVLKNVTASTLDADDVLAV
jgi:Ca2+-binding RTX toxin-like protein